jgi:hypothetical protein
LPLWKDPFSRKEFTERQRQYAYALGASTLYTPQMVVNGQDEFVGSNRSKAIRSIEAALSKKSYVTIKLKSERADDANKLIAHYEIDGSDRNHDLNIALVERGIVRKITRGENAGRILRHENVVRAFETIRLGKTHSGRIELTVPKEVSLQNASIIAFVQNPGSQEITGATGIEL